MNRVFINGFVFGLIMLSSCGDKSTVEEFETGLYGNTFINIEHFSFDIPDNWETDTFFNGAFKMDIPEYMEIADEDECISNKLIKKTIIYRLNNSYGQDYYSYGRIAIDYYSPVVNLSEEALNSLGYYGEFNSSDYLMNDSQIKAMFGYIPRVLTADTFPNGVICHDGDSKIINGPFYCSHDLGYKRGIVYDAFYRRTGHGEDRSPVSCHIFILQNKYDAVQMTISHKDKDSVLFKDFFNIVKTFRWGKVYE